MSFDLGTMYALVTLDDADYRKKLSGLEGASTSAFQNIAKAAAAYLSLRAIASGVRGAVSAFSDLEEETNKFNVVFAGMGERTSKVLAQMRKDFGLSEIAAKKMLAGTGDMLTGFGFDPELALVLSEGAAKLGADIASFSNYAGGAAGATSALTKAMLGEAESAKLLGVVIKQDSEEMKALKEQAMTTGITIKELGKAGENIIVSNEQQARAVAALALAYRQSPNAIGDFVRSKTSLANQTRILENNFEELTSTIGGDLAPAYRDALSLTNSLIKSYNDLSPASRTVLNNTLALTAAMAALSATKIGKNILTFKGNSSADIEAAKLKATEEVKRAETRMTTAQVEKDLARQNLNLAKNAVAAAENAARIATAEYRKAKSMRNTVAIAETQKVMFKAQKDLSEARLAEAEATAELATKTEMLNAATAEHAKLSAALPGLLNSIAMSATLAGNAALFTSAGFNAAAAAVKTFFASLGYFGWAIIGLSVAITAATAIVTAYNQALDENAKKAAEAADGAAKQNEQMRQTAASQLAAQERLQELGKYERLNNAEKEEAKKILEELGIAYDENGQSIEEMISKNGAEAKSLKDLIALKKEQLKQERISKLRTEIDAQQKAIYANDERRSNAAQAFGRYFGSFFGMDTAEERDADIDAENQKRYDAMTKAREEIRKLEEEGVTAERNIAEEARNTREALESLSDREWDIKFNTSDAAGQVDLLRSKISEIFNRQSGKFSNLGEFKSADRSKMNKEEIEDLEKIIDLEARRAEIEKRSAEDIERERKSYQEILDQRDRAAKDKAIDKRIQQAEQSGNDVAARSIMEKELSQAKAAASKLQAQYLDALETAEADKVFTQEERDKVERLKRQWQQALSDQDKWQGRIDTKQQNEEKKVNQAIGSFSLKVLSSQLGGPNKPELETARNTRRTTEILDDIKNNFGAAVYK